MTDATADDTPAAGDDAPAKKGGKMGLVILLVLALALGGGAFYATWSGLLDGLLGRAAPADAEGDAHTDSDHPKENDPYSDERGGHQAGPGLAFVEVAPFAVSIGGGGRDRQLRVGATLDVDPAQEASVAALLPRIQDSLLGYLRTLDPAVLAEPVALLRVRSQMLRRARMIAGDEAVRDLLVSDFVLN